MKWKGVMGLCIFETYWLANADGNSGDADGDEFAWMICVVSNRGKS